MGATALEDGVGGEKDRGGAPHHAPKKEETESKADGVGHLRDAEAGQTDVFGAGPNVDNKKRHTSGWATRIGVGSPTTSSNMMALDVVHGVRLQQLVQVPQVVVVAMYDKVDEKVGHANADDEFREEPSRRVLHRNKEVGQQRLARSE
ncbi:Aste57867_14332 [Aphanomyces stellatus]|uniref:Aste57867_14332 protein n=1 Tax=Aphanomyces stellatus TaxID=120398 RepID=A0A485L0P6_9STRA|nr:hypothetical protein As57867_014278 [Aphanomyces stellatus]VFT91156.1 Aste57867_14332 [Aphanomyces stellatus]